MIQSMNIFREVVQINPLISTAQLTKQIKHLGCDVSQDFTPPKFQLVLTCVMSSSVLTTVYGDPGLSSKLPKAILPGPQLMVQKNMGLLWLLYHICQPTYCTLYTTSNKTRQTMFTNPTQASCKQSVERLSRRRLQINPSLTYLSWHANIKYLVIRITSNPQTAPRCIAPQKISCFHMHEVHLASYEAG